MRTLRRLEQCRAFLKVAIVNILNPEIAVFFGCWIALCIASFLFFQFNTNATLKKRVFRGGLLIADALFLGLSAWNLPMQVLFVVTPGVVLITILNWWGTKFCPYCGKTMLNAYRAKFCSRCGESLAERDSYPPNRV
jgi:hypothetical protein